MFIQKIFNIFNEIEFKFNNLIIFFTSLILNLKNIIKQKTILGLKFIYPITIHGVYGKRKINFYYEIPFFKYDYNFIINLIPINTNVLLFDIGGHFGEVSYRFLKEKKGKAIIFEPNINNVRIIKYLFKKENITNYKLFDIGLGDKKSHVFLTLDNPYSYTGTILGNDMSNFKYDVNVQVFDEIINIGKFFDTYNNFFFKIDVEGFEFNVLKGMRNSIINLCKNKKVTGFVIEIKNIRTLYKIKNFFKKINNNVIIKKLSNEDYYFSL